MEASRGTFVPARAGQLHDEASQVTLSLAIMGSVAQQCSACYAMSATSSAINSDPYVHFRQLSSCAPSFLALIGN